MTTPEEMSRRQRALRQMIADEQAAMQELYGYDRGVKDECERIIKLLEVGGPIEQIICDYWGDPDFDKDDALVLIEKVIKGETE